MRTGTGGWSHQLSQLRERQRLQLFFIFGAIEHAGNEGLQHQLLRLTRRQAARLEVIKRHGVEFADRAAVRAFHIVGELDAMALYYLQSRGLPPGEAKKLMLQAFVAGVFDGAEDEEQLQALALAKLGELV